MEGELFSPAAETVVETCSLASEMTGNDEQEESSIMMSPKKESSKWTNEKHSLYLKSIEASFVDQLYNSLDMPSCQTQNTYCSDEISSGQYKVLSRGYRSKKSFKRQSPHAKRAYRPRVSPGNPWIQHFSNWSRKRLSSTATSQLDQHAIVTEGTDQNFVDDMSCSRKKV
ncbi:cold-regulated protein 27-like [Bidens hawaiensis]|uniref:cold-regulated protein 27-like n=1 Tax=Bidens hawaiensis TaxID=980011 RepID=UPI004049BABB